MNPRDFLLKLPKLTAGTEPTSIIEKWWPGMNSTIWNDASSPRRYPLEHVRALVLHATAGSSSAGAMSVMIQGNALGNKASWQWLIPDEDEAAHGKHIWACCPEARAAWHLRSSLKTPEIWDGRSGINHFSMGVEIVNAQISHDGFSDWQVQEAANIARYLWSSPKYPNFDTVISHARLDPTRRTDPGTLFNWDMFCDLVMIPFASDVFIPLEVASSHDCIADGEGMM